MSTKDSDCPTYYKCKLSGSPPPNSTPLHSVTETTSTKDYNPRLAFVLSYISAWSYSDLPTFVSKLEELEELKGGDFWQISVVNDALLVVAHAQVIRTADRKTILVSFRGTEISNIISYLTDTGTRKRTFRVNDTTQFQVHTGFYQNWKEVWEGRQGVLAHLLDPSRLSVDTTTSTSDENTVEVEHIYMTGHSLGGAMAVLGGLALFRESTLWNKSQCIYTFGQPMVMDCKDHSKGNEILGDKLYRFVYFNDLVPHLPPLSTGAFDHIGQEFKYIPADSGVFLWPWKWKDQGQWRKREFFLDNLLIRPRSTQVVSLLGAAPFAFADYLFYNVQWISFLKMPWSAKDHIPYFYVESFEQDITTN